MIDESKVSAAFVGRQRVVPNSTGMPVKGPQRISASDPQGVAKWLVIVQRRNKTK